MIWGYPYFWKHPCPSLRSSPNRNVSDPPISTMTFSSLKRCEIGTDDLEKQICVFSPGVFFPIIQTSFKLKLWNVPILSLSFDLSAFFRENWQVQLSESPCNPSNSVTRPWHQGVVTANGPQSWIFFWCSIIVPTDNRLDGRVIPKVCMSLKGTITWWDFFFLNWLDVQLTWWEKSTNQSHGTTNCFCPWLFFLMGKVVSQF